MTISVIKIPYYSEAVQLDLLRLVHDFVLEIQVQGQDFEQLELVHDHVQDQQQEQGSFCTSGTGSGCTGPGFWRLFALACCAG